MIHRTVKVNFEVLGSIKKIAKEKNKTMEITTTTIPMKVSKFGLFTPTEPITLNTDLKLYISRVDGAESQAIEAVEAANSNPYWVQATISKLSNVTSTIDLLTGTAVLSGQSSGTTIRYRWVGANTKKMEYN